MVGLGQRENELRAVLLAELLGHEHLDERLTEHLVSRVAGHAFGLAVEEHDVSARVEADDEQRRELHRLA